jgi:hypothetical protein
MFVLLSCDFKVTHTTIIIGVMREACDPSAISARRLRRPDANYEIFIRNRLVSGKAYSAHYEVSSRTSAIPNVRVATFQRCPETYVYRYYLRWKQT